MKSKGIVFASDRQLEEILLENLKGADLAAAAGGRDALPAYTSHAQHTFTRTAQLRKDGSEGDSL